MSVTPWPIQNQTVKFLCRLAKLCPVHLWLSMESLSSRLRSVLLILLITSINANYVLVATGSSQQVWEFLLTPIFASCQNIIGHKVASLPILLDTCRAIQLLHNLATPLFHQCPAYSHLRSQTRDWLILLGCASTTAISISMLRITLQ